MNFPVPVSREEIFEFITLAESKIYANNYFNSLSEETKYKDTWNKIWLKKIEQINSKAVLSMKNDKKSLEEVGKIVENSRQTLKNNNKIILHIAIGFLVVVVVLITLMSI
jgi:vacuolar-type H+-ATPase catalytic subunit A/Vma1